MLRSAAMNALRPWLNTLLLAAILTTLLLIWHRMPPTFGEVHATKGAARKELVRSSLYVRPDLDVPVSVDVGEPLEVKITQ